MLNRMQLGVVVFVAAWMAAAPAEAAEFLVPIIEAALVSAGIPTTIAVFGATIGVASVLAGIVTTSVGRGLRFEVKP